MVASKHFLACVIIIVGSVLLLSLYSMSMGSEVYHVTGDHVTLTGISEDGPMFDVGGTDFGEELSMGEFDSGDDTEDPKLAENDQKTLPPPSTTGKPVHVLLLTEGRSGSTWLSSFFWHRKDVYYTFEPLFRTVPLKMEGCLDSEEKTKHCHQEILGDFWKCDFHTSNLTVLGRYNRYGLNCSAVDCSVPGKEKMCEATTHRVAKTILFWHLEYLEDLMKDPNYDIRVIHLVRDPRPLVNSRRQGFFGSLDGIHPHPKEGYSDEQLTSETQTVCARMLDISKLGDNPPSWLQGRYMRITHEHMSLHPVETAKALYRFSSLPWTQDTEDFIYNSTVGTVGQTGAFGINRISADVINKWKKLPEEFIQRVTDACTDVIRYLGYEDDMVKIRLWKENDAELWDEAERKRRDNAAEQSVDQAVENAAPEVH